MFLFNKELNDLDINNIMIDECDIKEKDLTCKINRDKLKNHLIIPMKSLNYCIWIKI